MAAAAAAAREIVLVTGANSGIGFEITRQFMARGAYHVYLGARSAAKGIAAVEDLNSRKLPGSVEFIQLDVQSDEDINKTTATITKAYGKLDILVNNAAVAQPPGATEREQLQTAFDVNAIGPYLLAKSCVPLLRKSSNPRMLNISSGAGSIGRRLTASSPMYRINGVSYRSSKVALNMMTMCLYVEHNLGVYPTDPTHEKPTEGENGQIKVFCYDPGFTISNLGPYNKKEFGARSAEDTVTSIMEMVDGKRDEDGGKFMHNTGEYPW